MKRNLTDLVEGRIGAIAFLLAVTIGCSRGPGTYPAGGTVSFADGKPLTEGWVSFRALDDEKNVSARGEIKSDGTFVLTTFQPGDGAVAGRQQAIVVPMAKGMRGLPGAVTTKDAPTFDPRFSNYEKSGFEFLVTDDADANNFKLVIE